MPTIRIIQDKIENKNTEKKINIKSLKFFVLKNKLKKEYYKKQPNKQRELVWKKNLEIIKK